MKPESKQLMVRLDGTGRRRSGGGGDSLEKFLDDVTFRVAEHKIGSLPNMVCTGCSEELQRFATFRRRLVLTLQFMEALIDLKSDSNAEPLSKLFKSNQRELDALFKELNLCNKDEALVDDLLEEFTSYEFATMPLEFTIKEEDPVEMVDRSGIEDDDDDFRPANDDESDCNSSEDIKPEMVLVASEQDSDSSSSSSTSSSNSSDAPRKKRTSRRGHNFKKKPETTGQRRGRGRPRIHADGSFLKEPWACDKCKFTTKYRNAVERHKNVHLKRENKIYPCQDCKEVFKTYDEMRHHSLTHPENQVVCEVCGIALRNSYSLKAHMERHEDGRKYSCEYCDYTAQTSLSLKAHMSIHIRDNWNKRCEVCGVVFRTTSRLKRHMESHDNERKYACDQCPARFNTSNALRNHRTRVHLAIRHACEHCDKTYDQKIALRDHVERVHHIQCTFICDVCVQTFDSQEKLDVHRTRHAHPKPLECSICLALHTSQQDFDNHQCITYQEHYFCCGKDLRNHLQYNKHMMVKHNLKTNARVKPVPGILLGELRGARKRLEQCRKCDIAFPTRALKLQHLAVCNQQGTTPEKVPLPDPVPVHVPVPPVPVILPPVPQGQIHPQQQQQQPTMMMEIGGSGGVSTGF
uniref:Putative c2h2-type zn-finger protein n=1 Tax=Culex tarsalis TaxID=7177 RepID=A0A1Q3EYW1_CULTA